MLAGFEADPSLTYLADRMPCGTRASHWSRRPNKLWALALPYGTTGIVLEPMIPSLFPTPIGLITNPTSSHLSPVCLPLLNDVVRLSKIGGSSWS